MGKPIKIIDIAKELIRLSGFEPDKDIKIKITGARPGEKKIEELSLNPELLDNTKHSKIFVLNDFNEENLTLEVTLNELSKIESSIGK